MQCSLMFQFEMLWGQIATILFIRISILMLTFLSIFLSSQNSSWLLMGIRVLSLHFAITDWYFLPQKGVWKTQCPEYSVWIPLSSLTSTTWIRLRRTSSITFSSTPLAPIAGPLNETPCRKSEVGRKSDANADLPGQRRSPASDFAQSGQVWRQVPSLSAE